MTTRFARFIAFVAAGFAAASGNHEAAGHSRQAPLEPLERKGEVPEQLAGVVTEYGTLRLANGARVRTLVTRPTTATGRLPALLFIQWLSCDTVEILQNDTSGWAEMLRGIVQTPGLLVMRTEKPGVGDSDGPACENLDYETELSVHRQAYQHLRSMPEVDPERIFIFGASMGATMAPLVATEAPPAGIVIWGGGAKPWIERQLGFERRALELGGTSELELERRMARAREFYRLYLVEGLTPTEIAEKHPELSSVASELVGITASDHFGRPFAFHQQAQRQEWAAAWERTPAPVLVLYGEYDWFEDGEGHQIVADRVNAGNKGAAELIVFPGTDHHFMRYSSREDAFREESGVVAAEPVVGAIRAFLARHGGPS